MQPGDGAKIRAGRDGSSQRQCKVIYKKKMKKVILFTGGVETQDYFSAEIEKKLKELGHETFTFDYNQEARSCSGLLRFYEKGNTAMLTFNFTGICNEAILKDEKGVYIWESLGIPCINIVVDHPFYYDRFMYQLPRLYTQVSIDENHAEYLKRFYPFINAGPFIPLGGTSLADFPSQIPVNERDVDIVMTGSWAEPGFYEKYLTMEGPEYETFYRQVLAAQLENTDKTFEEIFEPMIRRISDEEVTDEALRSAYSHLICFDMYVRYYFRGMLVKKLAESGRKVVCVGGGWDHLPCSAPDNIIHYGYTTSEECLKWLARAKISINVMPWFKRGAHDRIFNSMLSGAVCLTDSSRYLDGFLRDGENCLLYRLDDMDSAVAKVKEALEDPKLLEKISYEGYELAAKGHTWGHRALLLHDLIEKS